MKTYDASGENLKLVTHTGTFEVKQTNEVCPVCEEEIQPGQLYLLKRGPRHVWCKE